MSKERIKELLGNGLKAEDVAAAIGCSASYISQLLSDEDFAGEVQSLKLRSLEAATARDKGYDTLEDILLERLKTLLPFMTKPNDLLRAISVINAAKRRGAPPVPEVTHHHVVELQLPSALVARYSKNSMNEIIEVNGRSMATLPGHILAKQVENELASKAADAQQLLTNAEDETVAKSPRTS